MNDLKLKEGMVLTNHNKDYAIVIDEIEDVSVGYTYLWCKGTPSQEGRSYVEWIGEFLNAVGMENEVELTLYNTKVGKLLIEKEFSHDRQY